METVEEIKKKILDASWERFSQYGFNKTTMSEIAKDCSMSASNIYRFFTSKNDILAEMATDCFKNEELLLQEIVDQNNLTAAQKLETLALKLLYASYDLFSNHPKINETIEYICSERCDLVMAHKQNKRSFITKILAEGIDNGEFTVSDIENTSDAILKAIIICHYPAFMSFHTLEELEVSAKNIIHVLLNGLIKR